MMQFVSQIMQKGMKSGYELRKGGYEVRKILSARSQDFCLEQQARLLGGSLLSHRTHNHNARSPCAQ